MSDPQVLTFRPEPSQYAWTFGGAPPVARIQPVAILELWTEDCFAGRGRPGIPVTGVPGAGACPGG